MGGSGTERGRRAWLIAVAVVLLGSLGYLLIRAAAGADRLAEVTSVPGDLTAIESSHPALVLLAIAAASALAALLGWWISNGRADGLDVDRDRTESEVATLRERLQAKESELDSERTALQHARHGHEEQRRWSRELAARLSELQRSEGALGGREDIRSLVLRVAISLTGAEKGILLSREDNDQDGDFDMVAYEGFDSDPEHSGIAQRYAGEVIEENTIVRYDRAESTGEPEQGAADDEIETLVAIPIYISDKFSGAVVCVNGEVLEHEDQVLVALGDHAGAILENSRLHGELRASYLATVTMLADAMEVKDPFLRGHSEEVSGMVKAMASRLGLGQDRREQLIFASLLHDIGKIGVSERILLKPGPLTEEEFAVIKLHPRIGYRLVTQVPLLQPIAAAILHHHERFDGTGYPNGLAGEKIPLEARVISIIDAYSAMISDRPYQAAVASEDALEELKRCAGTHFDPDLVPIFVEEVRAGAAAPERPAPESLAAALADPELIGHRDPAEPMLGYGSFASTDSLTLLHSHRGFRERLEEEIRVAALADGAAALAVVVVVVENLGAINRERGYAAGDRALRMLAMEVDRAAAGCGGYAGRDGSTRLAIAAPGLDQLGAAALERDLRQKLPAGAETQIAAATWNHGDGVESLLKRATAFAR